MQLIAAVLLFLLLPSLAAATDYYVDPDWGGTKNGAASTPWSTLDAGAWTAINAALADAAVTVYFSARAAGSDVDETTTSAINILRTDTSVNRLTLDGMSKYNTDDATPSWSSYSGSSKMAVTASSPVSSGQGTARQNVTFRGFKVVAATGQAFFWWGGDNLIVEENTFSHAAGAASGPGIYVEYVRKSGDTEEPCVPDTTHNCGVSDVIIRNNTVYDTYGECIYIGTCDSQNLDCSLYAADYHDGVTISGNTLSNCGLRGGEGDGIDPHGHSKNLTISGNSVTFTTTDTGRDCIITESAGTIEGNFLNSCPRGGINLLECWSEAAGFREGAIIRNNIITNVGTDTGLSATYRSGVGVIHGSCATITNNDHWTNTLVYNNTIYGGSSTGISFTDGTDDTGANVRNNIVSQAGGVELSAAGGALATHDYNLLYDTSGNIYTYGATSVAYNGDLAAQETNSLKTDPAFVYAVAPYTVNGFKVQAASGAVDGGVTIAGFTTDYFGVTRFDGTAWDIGAHEFQVTGSGTLGAGGSMGLGSGGSMTLQ